MSPLLSRFRDHARAGRVAIVSADSEQAGVSYDTLWTAAERVAAALLGERVSLSGERIALLVMPGPEFIGALVGVWLAGGCGVVLSPQHPPAESSYMCSDAGVGTVLVSRDWASKLGEAANGRRVVAIEDLLATSATPRAREADDLFSRAPSAQDDALQLYTSGTTGRPKGAVLTHDNLATQQQLVGDAWAFSPADTLLHALPLHHMHGLAIALFTALGAGAKLRMLPAFDAKAIWDALTDVTVFMGVPTMYSRLCDAYEAAPAETRERWANGARALRLATSGSAALPVPLATRWETIAGIIPVERFGMTEIGVGLTNPLAGPRKKGAVGFALPTVETRIVGEGGADAETGELWIRGPSVFRGYFGKDDATRDAFVAGTDGRGPWFKTGDTVTRDDDGAFRILGRTSVDILKSGGYKLSALEIEAVILELEAVREVAVVGVPDENWGDRVVACVVASEGRGHACTEEAIRAHVRTKLAPYKCPKEVRVMEALPRNVMGKVVKPDLVRSLARQIPPSA